jgi:hypothetical protein
VDDQLNEEVVAPEERTVEAEQAAGLVPLLGAGILLEQAVPPAGQGEQPAVVRPQQVEGCAGAAPAARWLKEHRGGEPAEVAVALRVLGQ